MDSHFMNPERIRRYPNSRLIRGIFCWVSEPTADGEVRLEKILTHYGKSKKDLFWKERISFLPVYLAIEILRIILHWKREYLIAEIFGPRNIRRVTINLARSIAEYGATQPQDFASPLLVVWNFTNLCNLRCRHCYQNAGKRGKQLSLSERLRVIDELDTNFIPVLAFSGGEPLCDPDFFTVARYAASQEIYLSVATNGVLLSEDVARKLKDSEIGYVEISLDSSYPEYHDNFRGLPGVWENLPYLYHFVQELGVQRFYVFNFIPTGRAKEIVAEDLSPREREEVLEFLYQCLMEKKDICFQYYPSIW